MDPIQEAIKIKKLQEKGQTQWEIAGLLKISQTSVSQKVSLLDLVPDLRTALQAKKIPLINAYDLARKTAAEQQVWYQNWKRGATRACPHCGYLLDELVVLIDEK